MTTKGYHRYRGRNTRGKVALVIVLVLVLIAAVAYLLTQEYVVYNLQLLFKMKFLLIN